MFRHERSLAHAKHELLHIRCIGAQTCGQRVRAGAEVCELCERVIECTTGSCAALGAAGTKMIHMNAETSNKKIVPNACETHLFFKVVSRQLLGAEGRCSDTGLVQEKRLNA